MKIYTFFLAIVLFFVGCSKTDEQSQPTTPEAETFTFTIGARQAGVAADAATDSQTRAILDQKASHWETDDAIALYARSYDSNPLATIAKLIAKILGDEGKWAKFTGSGLKPAAQDTYFAAYPAVTQINSSQVVFTIGTTQAATATPELMAAAKSNENITPEAIDLNFQPINAFLCVKMAEGLGITSVRFEGCDGEVVAGAYTYNFADAATTLTGTDKSITVENPGTECYITLPAITLSKGYKLTFFKGQEQMVKSYGYGKAKEFAAGGIYTTPIVAEFVPMSITLGEVRSTYKNPETTGLCNGKIYLSGNAFQGLPLTLIEETGIRYNVKGSAEVSTAVYDKTQLDADAAQKTFDLEIPVATELYEVQMYVRDVFGNTYTTSASEVGVLGANPAVSFSAASSWDTNGTVTKNNSFDLGGNGFRMVASLTDIAPSLVGSARFAYSGGRTGTADGTLSGTTYTSDITGLAPAEWAAYTVNGTVTLGNGRTFTGSQNTTVTGIPYTFNFDSKSVADVDAAGWHRGGTTSYSTAQKYFVIWYNYLGTKENGWVVSPKFNLSEPQTLSFAITVGRYSAGSSNNIDVRTGITTTQSATATDYDVTSIGGSNNSGATSTINKDYPLSSSTYVSIHHNSKTQSVTMNYLFLRNVIINYK